MWYETRVPDYLGGRSCWLTFEDQQKYKGWYYYDDSLFTISLDAVDQYISPKFTLLDAIEEWVQRTIEDEDHALRNFDFNSLYTEDGVEYNPTSGAAVEKYDEARCELGHHLEQYLKTGKRCMVDISYPYGTITLLSPGFVRELEEIHDETNYYDIGYGIYYMLDDIRMNYLFIDSVADEIIKHKDLCRWDTVLDERGEYAFYAQVERNGWGNYYNYLELAEDLEISPLLAEQWFPIIYDAAISVSKLNWRDNMLDVFDRCFVAVNGRLERVNDDC